MDSIRGWCTYWRGWNVQWKVMGFWQTDLEYGYGNGGNWKCPKTFTEKKEAINRAKSLKRADNLPAKEKPKPIELDL